MCPCLYITVDVEEITRGLPYVGKHHNHKPKWHKDMTISWISTVCFNWVSLPLQIFDSVSIFIALIIGP